jgi:LPS-assembly lipoprotein
MSSRDRRSPSRTARLALVLALPLLAAGCIHPLYGPTASGELLQTKLSGIVIDKVPDRFGHYLVQDLGFDLNGSGTEGAARYRLSLSTSETVQSSIVSTITGMATSATIIGTAHFTLTEIATSKEILSASTPATAAYTRNDQRFASVRAARDAEIRVAEQLAEQIRTRIAAKLSRT